MKALARWLVPAFMLLLVQAPLTARAADEVMVVEPLNTTLLFGIFQEVFVASKVLRPDTECGNPNGSGTLIECYEFAATYASYDANGQQVLHLPHCNGVAADHPLCDAPSNNLCAGNLALDPLQIEAPVCGSLRIDVEPLTTDQPLTLGQQTTAEWDGDLTNVSRFGDVFLETEVHSMFSGTSYKLPRIRIPASALHHLFTDPTTTPAIVSVTHTQLTPIDTFQTGFFNPLNRLFIFNQTLGDVMNTLVTPMFFGSCC